MIMSLLLSKGKGQIETILKRGVYQKKKTKYKVIEKNTDMADIFKSRTRTSVLQNRHFLFGNFSRKYDLDSINLE